MGEDFCVNSLYWTPKMNISFFFFGMLGIIFLFIERKLSNLMMNCWPHNCVVVFNGEIIYVERLE